MLLDDMPVYVPASIGRRDVPQCVTVPFCDTAAVVAHLNPRHASERVPVATGPPPAPATALRLQRFVGAEAEFWLNLQAMYDLVEERDRLAEELAAVSLILLLGICQ